MAVYQRTETERRIIKAIRTMPLARQLRTAGLRTAVEERRPLTLEDLAEYLEALQEPLRLAGEDEQQTEEELRRLRSDLLACGRIAREMGIVVIRDGGAS